MKPVLTVYISNKVCPNLCVFKVYFSLPRLRYGTNFGMEVKQFYRKYREQQYKKLITQKFRQLRLAAKTLKRFPNLDPKALEEQYPMVTIGEVKRYYESRGHRRNEDMER